jgi:hypothetical protein
MPTFREFELSEEQKGFIPWFLEQHSEQRCCRLIGYAGTGKTTVMQELDNVWPAERSIWCCPCHEAAGILTSKIGRSNAITLASALGLGPVTRNGRVVFVPKYRNKINEMCAVSRGKTLLVIDESSMVDLDNFRWVLDSDADRILFVGDPAQIPPIRQRVSPVYDHECSYPTYELTTLFRQAKDSSIAVLAEKTRKTGLDHSVELGFQTINLDEDGIGWFYRTYPDGKALCPTHKIKDFCNSVARRQLNGGKEPTARFIKGDYLFLESPIDPPHGPTNGSTVTILSVPTKAIFNNFQVWKMDVIGKYGGKHAIMIPDSEEERKAIVRHHARLEREYHSANPLRQREINIEVEMLANKIIFASHGFAMTIHKSQGSTLENVLLCVSGLKTFSVQGITTNMIYTGITRASKNLIIGR